MLEREDLQVLLEEKFMTEGADSQFWNSAFLIEGYIQPKGKNEVELHLAINNSPAQEAASFTILVDPNEPGKSIEQVSHDIIKKLLNTESTGTWDPIQEAEEYFRQGQLLKNHGRFREAMSPLETAHALQYNNVYYTSEIFENCWADFEARTEFASLEIPDFSLYTDLEMAHITDLLLHQILSTSY